MKTQINSKEVSKFLGMSQWYAKFIRFYADLCASPLIILNENSRNLLVNRGAEGVRCSQGGDNESTSFKIAGFQKAFRVVCGCQFNRRRRGSKSRAETSGACLAHA
ncbi:hypothetical protein TNCV_1688291 [Trichonephila clavipes]|nr:hypothetical protein TNCV_1688291 [Trichonephila clavipes]